MRAKQLKRFIENYYIEWHRHVNPQDKKEDVIILINFSDLKELTRRIRIYLEEEGISCSLKENHVSIWASDICTPLGISINSVFGDKGGAGIHD